MKKNLKYVVGLFLCLYLGVFLLTPVYSYSLKVKPDTIQYVEVPVGKRFQFRAPVQIYNEKDEAATFIMDVIKPSTIKSTWLKGYQEIPETTWYSFEDIHVKIPGHSVANVLMYINVPKNQTYYNQHWVVTLSIREKTSNGRGSARYAYPQVYLETEMKKWLKKRPHGRIGVVPSFVQLTELKFGENKGKGQITIYNNDSAAHTYTLTPTGEHAYRKKEVGFVSDGFSLLTHTEWLKLRKRVTIAAGETRVVKIDVELPEDDSLHKQNFESILFIEDEAGNAVFTRIRLEIK